MGVFPRQNYIADIQNVHCRYNKKYNCGYICNRKPMSFVLGRMTWLISEMTIVDRNSNLYFPSNLEKVIHAFVLTCCNSLFTTPSPAPLGLGCSPPRVLLLWVWAVHHPESCSSGSGLFTTPSPAPLGLGCSPPRVLLLWVWWIQNAAAS